MNDIIKSKLTSILKRISWFSAAGGEKLGNLKGRKAFWLTTLVFLLAATLFGLAYTQSVLYEGNQNTKFLHGLALAGRGTLQEDWLANTIDPLPAFSLLVYLTAIINENLFYIYYIVLMGVYVCSLIGISNVVFNPKNDFYRSLLIFALLLAIHARWYIITIEQTYSFNMEFLQYGLADQYLLGEEFQNSVFGVLLLLSIYLYLRKRYTWSVIWLGVACVFHSAYIFVAALMMAAYLLTILWDNWRSRPGRNEQLWPRLYHSARQPVLYGLLALAFVVPLVVYNQVALSSTSPEVSARALEILVHKRIPHHSLPAVWFNQMSIVQIWIMLAGTILTIRSRLFPVMLSLLLGGAAFTYIQDVTKNDNLALLSPWRVSVLLVPLAVTLIIAFGIYVGIHLLRIGRLPYALLVIPFVLRVCFIMDSHGLERQQLQNKSFRVARLQALANFVNREKSPGDVFLIPPKLAEFDDFRIDSQTPIFINWKSHPYKDTEVLEWFARVKAADEFYDADPEMKCGLLSELLTTYHLTHVIYRSKAIRLTCDFTTEIYRKDPYAVYAIHLP